MAMIPADSIARACRTVRRAALLSLVVGAASAATATGSSPVFVPAGAESCAAWSTLIPNQDPLSRYEIHPVYDSTHDRMIVYGGTDASGSPTTDVWALGFSPGQKWSKLATSGTSPTLYGYVAIYDPVRDRLLVFGDWYTGDRQVYALSLGATPTWSVLAVSGTKPLGRGGATAIYDPVRDRMLVFGGQIASTGQDVNETWALSLSGTPAWTKLSPAGIPASARVLHTAIYDAPRDRMVVFGGFVDDLNTDGNDVWSLSLAGAGEWSQLHPGGVLPGVRESHTAIFDPGSNRMIVFGGTDFSAVEMNDTWSFALSGTPAWTQGFPAGTTPSARHLHGAIYDAVRARMVVFGGYGPGTPGEEARALDLSGSLSWSAIAPDGLLPHGRLDHTAIYDAPRQRAVVFGGARTDGASVQTFDDLWSCSLDATPEWTQLGPAGTAPGKRTRHTAIFDPPRNRMVVFGGSNGTDDVNDVWSLSLSGAPAWTQLGPAGTAPVPRSGHAAIYDPVRDRMLVFGGEAAGELTNEVWALSLASPSWTLLAASGTPPPGMSGHAAVYDPVRDRMLVISGTVGGVGPDNEVWSLSLAGTPTWEKLLPAGTPPAVGSDLGAVYDASHDRVLVLMGMSLETAPQPTDKVYALDLAGSGFWSPVHASGDIPQARANLAALYDSANHRTVIVGGSQFNDVAALNPNDAAMTPLLSVSPPGSGTITTTPDGPCFSPGTAVAFTAVPALGHAFTGWSGDASGSANPITLTLDGQKTLVANFLGYPIVAGVDPPGSGTVNRNPDQPSYVPGTSVTLTAVPDTGYVFVSWSGDASGGTNPLTLVADGPKNVTAHFLGYPVHVSLSPPGGGSVSRNPNQSSYVPGSTVTLTVSTALGYTFDGWSGDASGLSNPLTLTVDGPKDITAGFTAEPVSCNGWSPITDTAHPGARELTAAEFDPPRHRMLVFGGHGDGFFNDLWSLSVATDAWTLLAPTGGPPSPRDASGMVYDPVRGRMLLIGGNSPGGALNDLWQLTLAGTPAWTSLTQVGTPPARLGPSVVYDAARDRLLMFGGYLSGPTKEVWELPLSGGTLTWNLLAPSGPAPAARYGARAIYDPVSDRMIVYGGNTTGGVVRDAWALTLSPAPAWHALSPNGTPPPGGYNCGSAYDPVRQRMLVFGGYSTGALTGETFALSLKYAPGWVALAPHGTVPNPLAGAGAAYDSDHQRFVIFGGTDNSAGTHFSDLSHALNCGVGGLSLDVSIDSPARGSVTKTLDHSCYSPGESVTLTATPTAGNVFIRWRGDVTGNANPITLVMNGHKAVTAMFDPSAAVGDAPAVTGLTRVVPNPALARARIEFTLASEERVRLTVHDVAGREVARLADDRRPAGGYSATWPTSEGTKLRAGIYFVRFEAGGLTIVRRLALLE